MRTLLLALFTLACLPAQATAARDVVPFANLDDADDHFDERTLPLLDARVIDADGRPIVSAEVSLVGFDISGTTDVNGRLRLAVPGAGDYVARVASVGYKQLFSVISVFADDTTCLDFALVSLRTVLASVSVRADAVNPKLVDVGFYERRDRSTVPSSQFITRDDIDRIQPSALSDLIARVPGARAQGCLGGRLLLNGVPIANRSAGGKPGKRPDGSNGAGESIDWISTVQVEAIEIYAGPAQIPPQFNGMNHDGRPLGCLIAIWTR